jgi:hypothetical protein
MLFSVFTVRIIGIALMHGFGFLAWSLISHCVWLRIMAGREELALSLLHFAVAKHVHGNGMDGSGCNIVQMSMLQ